MKILSSVFSLFLVSAVAANEAHDIMSQPHIARIVNDIQNADNGAEFACVPEVETLFECLGDECINCFFELIDDLDEDDTCETLAADDEFCTLVKGCVATCGATDCKKKATKVETCVAEKYPDAKKEENPCPDLCKEDEEDDVTEVPAPTDVSSLVQTTYSAHDIVSKPRIARIVNDVQTGEDVPCLDEVHAVLECISDEPCKNCTVKAVSIIEEHDTCETLAADEEFCPAVKACEDACGANGCKEKGEALETCAEQHYPDATEGEDPCRGLCEDEEKDVSEVPAPTDVSSLVQTHYVTYNIVTKPHIARIVSDVKSGHDVPCTEQLGATIKCFSDEACMGCIAEVFGLIEEDDDCKSLATDAEFCLAAKACEATCGMNDCDKKFEALENCAEEHYPDAMVGKEPCPGLCDNASVSLYEIA
eukprot:CAMPEP_0172528696 /NCGR_PEP_ID=MMETSP1067-20121228/3004_1 /TAXON_ID=265564 ORGANISM="Thalassiosira punctigera, Strain Tpunct2005C2" /NCGR_SAMPLE_ID=MMETSP1067 /ASSEMBLY_ACC=CAM_ASM_000444 /LENGTH=420 /DNA_ID=CAMNT_0013312653 /DNA_START=69 /DNA_END=1331 /DNA_ORIENTATION=+